MTRCVALISAGGAGSRIGGSCPKQYLTLLGKPLLAYSIEVLLEHPLVCAAYVVVSPDDEWHERFNWDGFRGELSFLRVGGATRAASVANGLRAIGDGAGADDWILVHDAARPCLSLELLSRLVDFVGNDDVGGLLASRITDTIKVERAECRVDETRSREGLWGAQTPQMFRRGVLERALTAVGAHDATDESSAVERLGYHPLLVESNAENMKVTYPGDLRLAETILKSRKDSQ